MSSSNVKFDDEQWDEEFTELQIINDMVLMQRFIMEYIEREKYVNVHEHLVLDNIDEFPSLYTKTIKNQISRDVLTEMYRDKISKQKKLFK